MRRVKSKKTLGEYLFDNMYCEVNKGHGFGTPHHIIYRSHGGPDEESNLITLCPECHGKAHFLEWPYLTREKLKEIKERKEPEIVFGRKGGLVHL